MSAITALPTAPSRSMSSSEFVDAADAWLAALDQWTTEVNAVASAVNITKWISGTTYALGDVAWSPIDFQAYRRKIAGAGTTDPSADTTNWQRTEFSATSAQSQSATAFTTAGTAPNFTLTPTPALTALLANQRFRVKFNAAGTTGSNTLAVSGLAAKSVKQYDSTGVKTSGIVALNQLADLEYDGTDFVILDPLPPAPQSDKIQPITASVASSAMTLTINPTTLDFRSATLGSGAVSTAAIAAAISTVISSGSTGGTVNGQMSRIAVLAIYNGGTPEVAWCNVSGGLNLDETTLISTTAEGGAGAADSANVIYSTTARSNQPFRVLGYVESTQATAGTWATAPSTIQGMGGQAMVGMGTVGWGQTWQAVTRTSGTTYYNTTGKPIVVKADITGPTGASIQTAITINGVSVGALAQAYTASGGTYITTGNIIIPPGASYVLTDSNITTRNTFEVR